MCKLIKSYCNPKVSTYCYVYALVLYPVSFVPRFLFEAVCILPDFCEVLKLNPYYFALETFRFDFFESEQGKLNSTPDSWASVRAQLQDVERPNCK